MHGIISPAPRATSGRALSFLCPAHLMFMFSHVCSSTAYVHSAAAVDGEGCTALHACCIDLNLAAERAEAGLDCHPAAVVALLLTRGCPVLAASNDGTTALGHCETHKGRHAAAAACADLLEEWASSKVLESTRL